MGGGKVVSVLCDSVRCVRWWSWERESGREDRSLLDKFRTAGKKNSHLIGETTEFTLCGSIEIPHCPDHWYLYASLM